MSPRRLAVCAAAGVGVAFAPVLLLVAGAVLFHLNEWALERVVAGVERIETYLGEASR